MKPFVERMEKELNELTERFEKLEKFVKSPQFYDLDDIDKQLLRIQLNAMKTYKEVLTTRFNKHKDD